MDNLSTQQIRLIDQTIRELAKQDERTRGMIAAIVATLSLLPEVQRIDPATLTELATQIGGNGPSMAMRDGIKAVTDSLKGAISQSGG